jgi:hypothetical protein
MIGSMEAIVLPADEVVIAVSGVQTRVQNASHAEASASDWCVATQKNLVDFIILQQN